MHRTQIYLTEEERKALSALARRLGKTNSELIREAVDRYVWRHEPEKRLELLRQARGIWKDRRDIPRVRSLRREFDRGHSSKKASRP